MAPTGAWSVMTGGDHEPTADLDSMLDVLSDRYRRRVLVALLQHNPQEDDDPQVPDDVTIEDENLDELKIKMRHVHLPKLADAGFIEWDQESNQIRTGQQFGEVRPLLELMQNHADELPDNWL